MKPSIGKVLVAGALAAAVAVGILGAAPKPWATSTLKTYDPGQWRFWGGDSGRTRYGRLSARRLVRRYRR